MNKILSFKNMGFIVMSLALAVGVYTAFLTPQKALAFTAISRQLYVGSTGQDVTNLQTFLASNRNIYPEGTVTGYYGSLTAKAVKQFQLHYGIAVVGWVGPQTLAKLNSVMMAGYGLDIYAPTITNPTAQKTNTSATFTWSTNETARGKVYYSPIPFSIAEAQGSFMEPVITGGSYVLAPNAQTSQNVTAQGLQPNTTYYYIIAVTDLSGNVSVMPVSTFKTNP